MPIYINNNKVSTFGTNNKNETLSDLVKKIYDADEIKEFRMDEAIVNSPLSRSIISNRSKTAYAEVMRNLKPTHKYLLPGQIALFTYSSPKYESELEYYDATPLVLFFGITKCKDGVIREIGFNLHYYPPYARAKVLNTVYEVFKHYYQKYFNDQPNRPNTMVNYNLLKRLLKNQKIKFGLRMYIPVLRGNTYVIPTRLLPIAHYTEGHFSRATMSQIQSYWRKFNRYK